MASITTKLEFFIYRAIDEIKSEPDRCYHEVIKTTMTYLNKFDIVKWRKLNENIRILPLLNKIKDHAGDSLSILVAFCLLSESIEADKFYSKEYYETISLAITSCLSTFSIEKDSFNLQLYSFETYVRLFLDPKVYEMLVAFDKWDFIIVSPNLIKLVLEIFVICPLSELKCGNYLSVEDIIKNPKSIDSESFFNGNYALSNVYRVLEDYINSLYIPFRNKDKRVISLKILKKMDETLPPEMNYSLVLSIAKLENDYDEKDRACLFDSILNYIFDFYITQVRKIEVVSSKGDLFLTVKDYLADYERESFVDEQSRMLVNEILKALRNYDADRFQKNKVADKLFEYIQNYVEFSRDKKVCLIMFLLFSYRLDILTPNDIDMISFIANFLDEFEIPAVYYKKYLDMFLESSIYKILVSLDQQMMFYCIRCILYDVTIEDIENDNYDLVYFYLSQFSKNPYSSLFKNDYSLPNIYNTLYNIMCDSRYDLFFKKEDRKKIEVLWDMAATLSEDSIEYLKESLHQIEKKYGNDKIKVVQKMVSFIYGYWLFLEKGIGVLSAGKKY